MDKIFFFAVENDFFLSNINCSTDKIQFKRDIIFLLIIKIELPITHPLAFNSFFSENLILL